MFSGKIPLYLFIVKIQLRYFFEKTNIYWGNNSDSLDDISPSGHSVVTSTNNFLFCQHGKSIVITVLILTTAFSVDLFEYLGGRVDNQLIE